jgi:hypothetical protein
MPRAVENIKARAPLGQRIPALDELRGIAVLAILFHHFNIMGEGARLDHIVGELANASWMGVDLFFVLSGFLITGILCDAKGHDTVEARSARSRSGKGVPLMMIGEVQVPLRSAWHKSLNSQVLPFTAAA